MSVLPSVIILISQELRQIRSFMVQDRPKSSQIEGEIPETLCMLHILHTADVQDIIIKGRMKRSTSDRFSEECYKKRCPAY